MNPQNFADAFKEAFEETFPKKERWRVAWRSELTGYEGHGEWSENEKNIRAWVIYGNKEWDGIIWHWIEKEN